MIWSVGPKIFNSQLDAWNLRLNAVGLEVNVAGTHIAETLPGPLLPPMLRLDAADAATFDDVAVAEAERFAAADAVLRINTKLLSMLAYMFECRARYCCKYRGCSSYQTNEAIVSLARSATLWLWRDDARCTDDGRSPGTAYYKKSQ